MSTVSRGSAWRLKVQRMFESAGFLTVVRGIGFAGDDITASRGSVRLSVEAKNQKRLSPSEWLEQAESNAPAGSVPIVVAHRRGRATPEDGYVIMTGSGLLSLISALQCREEQVPLFSEEVV